MENIDPKRQAEILETFKKDSFNLKLSPRELVWLFSQPENIAYNQLFTDNGLICKDSRETLCNVSATYDLKRGFLVLMLENLENPNKLCSQYCDIYQIELDWIASSDKMQAPIRVIKPISDRFGPISTLIIQEEYLADF